MKRNRFLLAALFSVTFILAMAFSAQDVSANNVRVFLDGVELNFTDVQPQIINNRTMVPIRETANHFGMEATWNEETATMFFTGPGRTMVHTVHTNLIHVNNNPVHITDANTGAPISSMIVNDRTLMPIRMLAEAIGHYIEWDPAGIVDIWTDSPPPTNNQPPGQGQPPNQGQPPAQPPASGEIVIFGAAAGRRDHEYGQPIEIKVETNFAADRVRVTDFAGNELATSNTFTYDSQGRYFTLNVTPTEHGVITLRVQAGNASGFGMMSRNVEVNIVPPTPVHTISITNLRLSGTTATQNRFTANADVEGTFRTSRDVVRIEVQDSTGRFVHRTNRTFGTTSTFYTWELDFRAPQTNGTHTYYVVAFDRNDNYETLQFQIVVTGGTGTGTGAGTGTGTGNNLNLNVSGLHDVISITAENRDGANNDIRRFHRVRFTITTNNTVYEVEILNRNHSSLEWTRNFAPSGSDRRVFEIEVILEETGSNNYYLRISDDWNVQDTRRINGLNVSDN